MTNTTVDSSSLESPLTQKEKRDLVEQDRSASQQASTYRDFSTQFVREGRESGRFAKSITDKVQPLPPNSPWSAEQPRPGDEAPLGVAID
jgi:hypothetical protein